MLSFFSPWCCSKLLFCVTCHLWQLWSPSTDSVTYLVCICLSIRAFFIYMTNIRPVQLVTKKSPSHFRTHLCSCSQDTSIQISTLRCHVYHGITFSIWTQRCKRANAVLIHQQIIKCVKKVKTVPHMNVCLLWLKGVWILNMYM